MHTRLHTGNYFNNNLSTTYVFMLTNVLSSHFRRASLCVRDLQQGILRVGQLEEASQGPRKGDSKGRAPEQQGEGCSDDIQLCKFIIVFGNS